MTPFDLLYHTIVALFIFLAAMGVGQVLLRALRLPSEGGERLWFEMVAGLGVLSVGTLLLGMAALFHPWFFGAFLLPLALLGALRLARAVELWRRAGQWLLRRGEPWPERLLDYLLLALSLSTILWITLAHALMPPHEWDEVAYHLTLAQLYVQAGSIIYVPYIVQSNWPLNQEMLFAIALMLRSDIATHLLMLGQSLLVALGLLLVARRLFHSDRVGLVAVALFFTAPLVKRLAGTGLIDVGMGLYVLAALVAYERWTRERKEGWLLLAGLLSGFVAGCKLSGAAIPLLIGLLLLGHELWQRPFRPLRALRPALLFGLSALLVAAPWYLRSLYFTGNPIWPFAFRLFGGRDWDALGDEYFVRFMLEDLSLPVGSGLGGLIQSYEYVLLRPAEMGGFRGGIGMILPVGGLLSGLLLLHRHPAFLRYVLFLSAGFYLLWFALLSLQVRFLLPVVPLLALASAALIVRLYHLARPPFLRVVLAALLLAFLLVEWPWGMRGERHFFTARLPYLQGELSREAWLARQIDSIPLFDYANRQLPPDRHVLLLPYENRSYYLNSPYTWGHPISQRIIPFEQFDDVGELAATLRARGITHVIDVPTWINSKLRHWEHDRALMLALQQQCGKLLFQQGESVLYELVPCTAAQESP